MKVAPCFAIAFACVFSFSVQDRADAKGKDKWVCLKDGEEVKVKGKKPKDKEKDCKEQEGVWEKAKSESAEKQESGMGGAW